MTLRIVSVLCGSFFCCACSDSGGRAPLEDQRGGVVLLAHGCAPSHLSVEGDCVFRASMATDDGGTEVTYTALGAVGSTCIISEGGAKEAPITVSVIIDSDGYVNLKPENAAGQVYFSCP